MTNTHSFKGKVRISDRCKNDIRYNIYTGQQSIPISDVLDQILTDECRIRIYVGKKLKFNKSGILLKNNVGKCWKYSVINDESVNVFDDLLWDLAATDEDVIFQISHIMTEEEMQNIPHVKLEEFSVEGLIAI